MATSETPTKRRTTKAASDADQAQEQSITEAWNAGADFASEPASEEVAAAPKRTRKKKTDEPAAEAAPATDETTEAVAEEAKPKRTRKKATEEPQDVAPVETEPVVEAEPVAEAGPVAEAEAAAPAVEDEAKPKRSRKKAEAEAEPKSLLEIAGEKPSTEAADAAPQVAEAEEPAVESAAIEEEETPVTFSDLGLHDALLKSITAVGYEEPTPIQLATIPLLLAGNDVIAQAQTGSGKTAAFGLPIIEAINPKQRNVQALMLAPTRELAIQVAEALHKYGRHKEVETLADLWRSAIRAAVPWPAARSPDRGRHARPRHGPHAPADARPRPTSSSSCSTRPTRCSTWASSRTSSGSSSRSRTTVRPRFSRPPCRRGSSRWPRVT